MLALRRLLLPPPGGIRPRLPLPATPAGRVVLLVYVASAALLLSFVARHVSRVPFNDEYGNFHFFFGTACWRPAMYWGQHNEHRIPLPRVVYVAAVRLTGLDFRAPVFVNAALLGFAAAYLLRVVHRVRGRFSYSDAFIPLTVLGLGGWENLIWGFQLQFVLSTTFILGFLGQVVVPGFVASTPRVAAAGVLLTLMPLCGANGVAVVPALGLYLLYVGGRNILSADRTLLRPGIVAVLGGVAGLALLAAYFHDLRKVGHHPPPPNPEAVVYAAVNFLGLGMGPVTHLLHSPGYDRVTAVGAGVLGLVAVTGVLLGRAVRGPGDRPRAVGIGCVLGGLICLAGGLAYGRAGYGNIMGASRYITLAMPIPITAYFAWVSFGQGRGGRVVPVALFAASLLFLVPNTRYAFQAGLFHAARLKKVEFEIKDGVPLGFIADGNRTIHPGPPDWFRSSLGHLRDAGVKPFAAVRPDPPLATDPVPVRVLRVEGMTAAEDGSFRVTGDLGTVVFAIPCRRHVFGLALTYEAEVEHGRALLSMTSWDFDGHAPPRDGRGVLDQLMVTDGPVTTRIFVDREVDTLRIDIATFGTKVRIHGLAILSRTD
ncbi:MAG: hypothetical protein JWO38_3848 [Gemmataceae bacterium]|nr:hypothetical protein [Gemmataceae bacterium]